ncbi:alpha-glucosidase C-terminal domain-containing protein, partial [Mycobacterium tuberculosis]|nr:alpha-glucosidase C-terminal domain-containing protein [Mycobacterium tuberculosis]
SVHLPEYAGRGTRELFGGEPFGEFSDTGDYRVTLGSQDFFWLRLRQAQSTDGNHPETVAMPIIKPARGE